MGKTMLEPKQADLLKILGRNKDGRLPGGQLRDKLWPKSKKQGETSLDPSDVDWAITGLIEKGLIATDGAKDGPHPRKRASYRLTERGRDQLRPSRPDFSDEQLQAQEAFILLQIFRSKEQNLTRSELNGKLKTKAAVAQLEFDIKDAPDTVTYHLAELVKDGCLIEARSGNSFNYSLDHEEGVSALATVKQHEGVEFKLTGKTLNALLAAARKSRPASRTREEPVPGAGLAIDSPHPETRPVGPMEIERYVAELHSDKYAGKDLIPIHEVRRLVADHHGADAAGHPEFDPLIKRMRSDGQLRLIAIADNRDATQEQLDNSIPGMNEILFYIVVQ